MSGPPLCRAVMVLFLRRIAYASLYTKTRSVGFRRARRSVRQGRVSPLWMLVKAECLRGRVFTTRAQASLALFEYIKGFHNPRRIQKCLLGWRAPVPGRVLGVAPQRRADFLDRAPTAGASSIKGETTSSPPSATEAPGPCRPPRPPQPPRGCVTPTAGRILRPLEDERP
ncbi:IS3 family transposase [Streptomyces sp. NPDC001212]